MARRARARVVRALLAALVSAGVIAATGLAAVIPDAQAAASGAGSAGSSAVTVADTDTSASAPCVVSLNAPQCQSTDPDLTIDGVLTGDSSGCTFTFSINWDDGSAAQQATISGQPQSGLIFLADHTYQATQTQTYSIVVTAVSVTGGCSIVGGTDTFTLVAGSQPTTMTTSLSGGGQSGTSISVPAETAVTDTAILSGTNASTATGTVTYNVYSDSACTVPVSVGTVEDITTPGTLPASSPVTLSAGTHYWQASYSGDASNGPSTSACGTAGEVETVQSISVAQLGDSIASGEGTLYGYTYDAGTGRWSNPATPNPAWTGDYPYCHDSPDAYGEIVAKDLGSTAPLSQFACTGASYLNGITEPETELAPNGTSIQDRPVELGPPGGPYNSVFTAAKPGVVLVTFGADDVQFVKIVLSCAITNNTNIGQEGSLVHTACLPCLAGGGRSRCVPGGEAYQKDFVDELPALNTYYGKVVDAIEDALAPGPPPIIVFTDYMNPFPAQGTCHDTAFLSTGQISFLSGALNTLDNDIQSDVEALEATNPNVGFADIRNVLAGHTWCSSHPWDYGLSIDTTASALRNLFLYKLTDGREGQPLSPAPFHPTPAGQQAIAKVVLAKVQQLMASQSTDSASG